MAINKVIYQGNTLIDLTSDTVTPEALAEGVTAHSKSGKVITGIATGGSSANLIEGTFTESGTYEADPVGGEKIVEEIINFTEPDLIMGGTAPCKCSSVFIPEDYNKFKNDEITYVIKSKDSGEVLEEIKFSTLEFESFEAAGIAYMITIPSEGLEIYFIIDAAAFDQGMNQTTGFENNKVYFVLVDDRFLDFYNNDSIISFQYTDTKIPFDGWNKIIINNTNAPILEWKTASEGLKYYIDNHHNLYFYANGRMPDFSEPTAYSMTAPWQRQKFNIITFLGDITYIGANTFYQVSCSTLYLPRSLEDMHQANDLDIASNIFIPKTFLSKFEGYCRDAVFSRIFTDGTEEDWYQLNFSKQIFGRESNGTLFESISDSGIFNGYTMFSIETIPDSITEIKPYLFDGQSNLGSITLHNNVISIGAYGFNNCIDLYEVVFGTGVTSIGHAAFGGCTKLKTITIPSSVEKLGISCFSGSGIQTITIPASVNEIGRSLFHSCSSLVSAVVEENEERTILPSYMFFNCTLLKDIVLPNNILTLGDNIFAECSSLTNITLPENLTTIEYRAFYNCINLNNLIIPASVTSIGGANTFNCASRTNKLTIKFLSTVPPTITGTVTNLFNTKTLNKIIVPLGCGNAYKTATSWSTYASFIEEAAE